MYHGNFDDERFSRVFCSEQLDILPDVSKCKGNEYAENPSQMGTDLELTYIDGMILKTWSCRDEINLNDTLTVFEQYFKNIWAILEAPEIETEHDWKIFKQERTIKLQQGRT